jgi:hypothetical protein
LILICGGDSGDVASGKKEAYSRVTSRFKMQTTIALLKIEKAFLLN